MQHRHGVPADALNRGVRRRLSRLIAPVNQCVARQAVVAHHSPSHVRRAEVAVAHEDVLVVRGAAPVAERRPSDVVAERVPRHPGWPPHRAGVPAPSPRREIAPPAVVVGPAPRLVRQPGPAPRRPGPATCRSTAASRPRRMGARSDRTAGPSPSSRRAGGQARTGRGEAPRRPADRPSFRRSAACRRSPAAVRQAALPESHQSPGPGATAAPVPAPAPWPAGRSRPRRRQRRPDVPRSWNTRPWHSLRAPCAMIAIRRTPTRLGTRSPVSVARISAQRATRANQPPGRR